MTPSTQPHAESYKLAQIFESVAQVGTNVPVVATRPGHVVPLIVPAAAEEPIPPGYKTIDDIVRKFEHDPSLRQELTEGRRWVADTVLAGQPVTLRTLRLRKGMSQTHLAKAIGTRQPHIARIENGHSDLRLDTCRRIAQVLGVDLNTLDQALQAETGR